MLMVTFRQAVLGPCKHVHVHVGQTVLAEGRQWVANLMKFWPQHEHHTIYAISLLKHVAVVLSKSEGPQKWLAPCGTDVHRVARTIDVYILEKESYRQNNIMMRNEVLIAQNMRNLGARSVCSHKTQAAAQSGLQRCTTQCCTKSEEPPLFFLVRRIDKFPVQLSLSPHSVLLRAENKYVQNAAGPRRWVQL
jgi:hypothetical protein